MGPAPWDIPHNPLTPEDRLRLKQDVKHLTALADRLDKFVGGATLELREHVAFLEQLIKAR